MIKHILNSLLLSLIISTSVLAAYRAPIWSRDGMAATPHPAATEAAVGIMQDGGNAIDAAVAAAFVLSVVEPYHSGLGGGGFIVSRLARTGETIVLDARESAPSASTPDMYIDPETGEAYENRSWRGGLAVGVPGSVAGRVEMIKKYGRLPLRKVIEPAERLASKGFIVDRIFADRLSRKEDLFAERMDISRVFFHDGKPVDRGDLLRQPQLAWTLSQIARDDGASFYSGEQASSIAKACLSDGGILTAKDMKEYALEWRDPVRFDYRDYEILSMPPPSSGGVCLALILNILEGYPLDYLEQGSAESYHLIASAFETAFADRAKWLGDPGFNSQPVKGMSSEKYAETLRKKIDRHKRSPVRDAGDPWQYDDKGNTSHISVIDYDGNMCSITTSVNSSFGSCVFVPELGIFLNSTMDDFAITSSEPNLWGLIGNNVNSIAPGKRPLSSMSPTLVLKDGKPFMAVGSVGGPRIITSVAMIIINVIDYEMNIRAAIDAPRIHMQWKPDKLYTEEEIPWEVRSGLESMGWIVSPGKHWSLSQGVIFDSAKGDFYGASDARGVGSAGPERAN